MESSHRRHLRQPQRATNTNVGSSTAAYETSGGNAYNGKEGEARITVFLRQRCEAAGEVGWPSSWQVIVFGFGARMSGVDWPSSWHVSLFGCAAWTNVWSGLVVRDVVLFFSFLATYLHNHKHIICHILVFLHSWLRVNLCSPYCFL